MKQITKILTVLISLVFTCSGFVYASSFSDFFTKSNWSKGVQNFATKSVYRDTLKNKIGSATWWKNSAVNIAGKGVGGAVWVKNTVLNRNNSVAREKLRFNSNKGAAGPLDIGKAPKVYDMATDRTTITRVPPARPWKGTTGGAGAIKVPSNNFGGNFTK